MLEGLGYDPSTFQADGVHPTAAAQPIILNNIWKTLKPMLAKIAV
jgi:acyl-CoA thioesterase-1